MTSAAVESVLEKASINSHKHSFVRNVSIEAKTELADLLRSLGKHNKAVEVQQQLAELKAMS